MSNQPIITLIVAASINDAIGKDNGLPWALPSELKHFKEYTLGKILVCGKNTFLFLTSLLKNRKTIILSKNENTLSDAQKKVDLFKSKFPLEEVPFVGITDSVYNFFDIILHDFPDTMEICVIGGEQIYKEFYPFADKIIYTSVNCEVENADAFFDPPDVNNWIISSRIVSNFKTDSDDYSYSIYEFKRIPHRTAQIVSIKDKKPLGKLETIKLRLDSK